MGDVGYWLYTGHALCNIKHVLDITLRNTCVTAFVSSNLLTALIPVLMFFIITGSDRVKVKDLKIQTEITKTKDQQVQTGSLAKQQGLYVKLSFH